MRNIDLLFEVVSSKNASKSSSKLIDMFVELIDDQSIDDWMLSVTTEEDLKQEAMTVLLRTCNNFKPELSDDVRLYFTDIIKSSFIQLAHRERKQKRDLQEFGK